MKNMMETFLSFIPQHTRLQDILIDQNLARLGDAYVNFIYSIALSKKKGKPAGAKVSSRVLAQALKKANLRKNMPKRMDRHALGDAVEALVVYAWAHGAFSIEENVTILLSEDNAAESFATLLRQAKEKLNF